MLDFDELIVFENGKSVTIPAELFFNRHTTGIEKSDRLTSTPLFVMETVIATTPKILKGMLEYGLESIPDDDTVYLAIKRAGETRLNMLLCSRSDDNIFLFETLQLDVNSTRLTASYAFSETKTEGEQKAALKLLRLIQRAYGEIPATIYSENFEQSIISDVFNITDNEAALPVSAGEPGEALTKLEQGIIKAYEELSVTEDRITDDGISTWLASKGIINSRGNGYSREHINRTKNKLIDGGHLKV